MNVLIIAGLIVGLLWLIFSVAFFMLAFTDGYPLNQTIKRRLLFGLFWFALWPLITIAYFANLDWLGNLLGRAADWCEGR